MNRNEFIEILEERKTSDRQLLAEINELVTLFPYFQCGHLLLLRTLNRMSDVRFETQLRSSALYIADREVLYNIINTPLLPPEEKVKEIEAPLPAEDDPGQDEHHQTVIDNARNSDDLICEIEKESDDSDRKGSGEVAAEVVSRPILTGDDFEEEDQFDSTILQLEDEPEQGGESVIYMDPGISVPDKHELLELENGIAGEAVEKKNDEGISDSTYSIEEKDRDRKKTQSDLIDRFIMTNPRIEPVRDKSDAPREDIARPFTEDQGSFITETLARIYLNQGYYSKAIDIYEKLSLKFPEKSSYFAAQIGKVKELIK